MSSGIRLLAWRTLKANQFRILLVGIAIMLVSLLFTTVISITSDLAQSVEITRQLATGSDFHAFFQHLDKNQCEKITKHKLVQEFFVMCEEGKVTVGDPSKEKENIVLLSCQNEKVLPHLFAKIVAGTYPQTEKEILLPEKWLDKKQIPKKIGTTISIDVNEKPRTFTLCGYYSTYADTSALKAALTYNKANPNFSVYLRFSNTINIEGKGEKILADTAIDVPVQINNAFFMASHSMVSPSTIALFLLTIAIVFFCGFLLIYNIYHISITKDIHFYGLLKTLGTTRKQLRNLIWWQVNIIYLIFMPFGLALSYFIGWKLLSPLFMTMSGQDFSFAYRYNLWIFGFTLIFTYITTVYSAIRPIKNISRMSCVNALLEGESTSSKRKTKHSMNGSKPWRMALSHLGRDPKKTIVTLFSLSLSMILFLFIMNTTQIMQQNSIGQPADFRVSPPQEKSVEYKGKDGGSTYRYETPCPITKEICEEIMKIPEIKQAIPVYTVSKEVGEYSWQTIQVIGIPLAIYPYLNLNSMIEGTFDAQKLETGEYALSNTYQKEDDTIQPFYYVDEIISLPSLKREYTVLGVSEGHHSLMANLLKSTGYFMNEQVIYLSEKAFLEEFDTYDIGSINLFIEKENYAIVKEKLGAYAANGLILIDKMEQFREFEARISALNIVGYSLCGVMFLIGLLNFINTTLCGMFARRHEFALLEIVGMTKKQSKRMLRIEGLSYVILTGIVSFLLGTPFISLVYKLGGVNNITVNLLPILFMVVILAIAAIIVTELSHYSLKKHTLIEHLRSSE